jgi:hypothetical protein
MNIPITQCYKKLNQKCSIRKKLLEFCLMDNNWEKPETGTFFKKTPSKELLQKDDLLNLITDKFLLFEKWSDSVNIFLLKPWTHYILHQDKFRESSLNLLINFEDVNSLTYFQTSEIYNKLHFEFSNLEYELDSFYLFNSKIPHAVTNFDNPRYLLSITLKGNFDDMKNTLHELNFLD